MSRMLGAGRRLALLTALTATLTLVTATSGAAYPIGPDGEPLYGPSGQSPALTTGSTMQTGPVVNGDSTPAANVLPVKDISSSGTVWSDVLAAIGVVALAALAVVAAAFFLTGDRRRSVKTN